MIESTQRNIRNIFLLLLDLILIVFFVNCPGDSVQNQFQQKEVIQSEEYKSRNAELESMIEEYKKKNEIVKAELEDKKNRYTIKELDYRNLIEDL